MIQKVLIANRGEIAIRVIRACKDAGLTSVAIYADPDKDSLHVKLADEAYALGGSTPGESYLSIPKIIDICKKAKVDAVHPGYGFLSENGDFAEAVTKAGFTWIGPSADAIRTLGDKVAARHIAQKVGAPLVPGTKDPVKNSKEVVDFAKKHGLPVAIKAAFGGGGRGLKVAFTLEEIPELFDSAVREAETAFGNGECFVERFLHHPRHVEAQVLADTHGNVVVVGLRDCSLQRRHQKLVEEAPAPFLTEEQESKIRTAAHDICLEAKYTGAGTCEFLVGADGTVSFLEVNTRLQVEHPVTEETTGIDLVREMFRIANGEDISDVEQRINVRGHAIEFRINGEDPGRNFLPAPGVLTTYRVPSGPGVRYDGGFEQGDVIGGNFDSLLAKLIVTGETRKQAIERARRVLDEYEVEGIATALTFDRVIVNEPAWASDDFRVYTTWIEDEFVNNIEAYKGTVASDEEAGASETVVVEVDGRRVEVKLPAGMGGGGGAAAGPAPKKRKSSKKAAAASENAVVSPMQGTLVKVAVADGDTVAEGDLVCVIEAMKMENPVTAGKAGVIKGLKAEKGQTVGPGEQICEIVDPA